MSVVTLVAEDNKMVLDGEVAEFDLGLDDNIWAIQWDGSKGQIEYKDGSPNKDITKFPELESLVEKHNQTKVDAEAKVVAEEAAAKKKRTDAMTYADKRAEEYGKLNNQFEMIYDDKVNDTTTWVDAIKAIKKAIPKE
ncbi:MAG: hypothetical protein HN683_20590 [Gammaproteobacteria bacterium]|jgi:hypothetical protein|nr:hypothetical protein [Gammaproteobacteria bacterium]